MKYNPSEHWKDKLARIDKMIASRTHRLFPSPRVRQEIARIETRRSTPIAILLDQPTHSDPEQTQGERLLEYAVRPRWWARAISIAQARREVSGERSNIVLLRA